MKRFVFVAVLVITMIMAISVAPPAPTPVAAPVVRVLNQPGPDPVRTWRPNLWSWKNSSEEGRKILERLWHGIRGRQSIDLDGQIMKAASDGKIKPYVACEPLKFEWFDIDESSYLRDTIWVTINDGGVAKRVEGRPSSTSQGLFACGGNATLTIRIEPIWINPDMSFSVTTP
ncbi:MAG: hypothetical protein V1763_02400, partial [Parcubacteria group bacterium]